MPEATDFIPWNQGKWDNLNAHSGTRVDKRPYYYKIIDFDEGTKILIISAVERGATLHATDYLRLDLRSFEKLTGIANAVLGRRTSAS